MHHLTWFQDTAWISSCNLILKRQDNAPPLFRVTLGVCVFVGSDSRKTCKGKRKCRSGGGSGISRLGALRHCGRAGQSFKMHGLGGRRPSEMSLAVMGGESARTQSPYRVRWVCVFNACVGWSVCLCSMETCLHHGRCSWFSVNREL